MGKLTYLVIHCTATPEGMEVTPDMIKAWHTSPPPNGRGWKQIGYTDLINLKGEVVNMVKHNEDDIIDAWEITNGAVGINDTSRHIVYSGGMTKDMKNPKDTRNEAQLLSMKNYVVHTISLHPDILIAGHNQFASKACPSFETRKWLKEIGIADKNIYDKETFYFLK